MPSIRKRIGYLPSLNIQKIIVSIAKNNNLSQSKVVGILVEEALINRGVLDHKRNNDLTKETIYSKINNSSLTFSDIDELISDKGITYNIKNFSSNSDNFTSKSRENHNEDLFDLFKQFILFQKKLEEEK